MTARVAWLVVTMQLATTVAGAEPDDGAAQGHLDRGIAAYRARAFTRAVDELLEANRLAPERPDPYRWLALTEAEIDDCQSALINIDTFVARVPAGDPRVPELLALRSRCQHTGTIDVDSTPGGAAIRVDGGPPIGTTPARHLAVATGPHAITVEKRGFDPGSRRIDVRALGSDYASFVLTPSPDQPLIQRWWFWPVVSAVALGAAIAAVSYGSSHDAAPSLPGVTCSSAGCHP